MVLLIFLLAVLYTNAIADEVISWTDDYGVFHFTDQYSNVPQKYMKKIRVREDIKLNPPEANPALPSKPKHSKKINTLVKYQQNSGDNPIRVPSTKPHHVQGGSAGQSDGHRSDGKEDFNRMRREIHRDTKQSQEDAYNSQSDARKATIKAEKEINKAANVGQSQINDARKAQQNAQDLINRARNVGTTR
jgi:hypothetical protein